MANCRRSSNKRPARDVCEKIENDSNFYTEDNDAVFIPDADFDDAVDNSEKESDDLDEDDIKGGNYEAFHMQNNSNQKLLENNHVYKWIPREVHDSINNSEEIFLSDELKHEIKLITFVEIFELFNSREIKEFIIQATRKNGYELSMDKFNAFVGILVTSIFNSRKKERDYWSKDDLLRHDRIANTMSRDDYLEIKRFLKLS